MMNNFTRILSFDVGISSLSYCLIRYNKVALNDAMSDIQYPGKVTEPLKVNDLKKRNLIVPKVPDGSHSLSDIENEFKSVNLPRVSIEQWENINICEDNEYICKDNNKLVIDKIITNLVKTLSKRDSIFFPESLHLDHVLVEKQFFNPMNRSSVKGSLKNSNISFSLYTYFFKYALNLKENEKKKCSVHIFSAREKLKIVKDASNNTMTKKSSRKRKVDKIETETPDDYDEIDEEIQRATDLLNVLKEENNDTNLILKPLVMVKSNDKNTTNNTITPSGKKKYNHMTNKKLGIIRAFHVLDNGIQNGEYWRKRLLITKKQDDLSDSLLQALAFIEKNSL